MNTRLRPRIQVWSDREMVTPSTAKVVPAEGAPVLLQGTADDVRAGSVAYVCLDDGREVLIAVSDLTVLP